MFTKKEDISKIDIKWNETVCQPSKKRKLTTNEDEYYGKDEHSKKYKLPHSTQYEDLYGVKWFKYPHKTGLLLDKVIGCKDQMLEYAKPMDHKFFIQREYKKKNPLQVYIPGEYENFKAFGSYSSKREWFYDQYVKMHEKERTFSESIPEGKPMFGFIDVEWRNEVKFNDAGEGNEEWILNEGYKRMDILRDDHVMPAFQKLELSPDIPVRIRIGNGSRAKAKGRQFKCSFHLNATNVIFEDYEAQKEFMQRGVLPSVQKDENMFVVEPPEVDKKPPKPKKKKKSQKVDTDDEEDVDEKPKKNKKSQPIEIKKAECTRKCIIDSGVYKTLTQFRMPGSYKADCSKQKIMDYGLSGEDLLECFITADGEFNPKKHHFITKANVIKAFPKPTDQLIAKVADNWEKHHEPEETLNVTTEGKAALFASLKNLLEEAGDEVSYPYTIRNNNQIGCKMDKKFTRPCLINPNRPEGEHNSNNCGLSCDLKLLAKGSVVPVYYKCYGCPESTMKLLGNIEPLEEELLSESEKAKLTQKESDSVRNSFDAADSYCWIDFENESKCKVWPSKHAFELAMLPKLPRVCGWLIAANGNEGEKEFRKASTQADKLFVYAKSKKFNIRYLAPDKKDKLKKVEKSISFEKWSTEMWHKMPTFTDQVFHPRVEANKKHFNTYPGFRATLLPRDRVDPSKFALITKHIKEVIANGDDVSEKFILSWLAYIFKRPWEKTRVALLLVSELQQIGKGIFVNWIMSFVFGRALVTQEKGLSTVSGKFNEFIQGKLILLLDELGVDKANWMETWNTLKQWITEPFVAMHEKFKNKKDVENWLNIIICSNFDDCANFNFTDARFAAFEVSAKYRDDAEYFKKLTKSMEDQEVADHFFSYLYHMDESELVVPKDNIPDTPARRKIIDKNCPPVRRFWQDIKAGDYKVMDSLGEIQDPASGKQMYTIVKNSNGVAVADQLSVDAKMHSANLFKNFKLWGQEQHLKAVERISTVQFCAEMSKLCFKGRDAGGIIWLINKPPAVDKSATEVAKEKQVAKLKEQLESKE